MRYLSNAASDRDRMLSAIGRHDVEELFSDIPAEVLAKYEPIGLEPPDPSAHAFELGVMRVEEQIEQPRIPLDTATVLWRG